MPFAPFAMMPEGIRQRSPWRRWCAGMLRGAKSLRSSWGNHRTPSRCRRDTNDVRIAAILAMRIEVVSCAHSAPNRGSATAVWRPCYTIGWSEHEDDSLSIDASVLSCPESRAQQSLMIQILTPSAGGEGRESSPPECIPCASALCPDMAEPWRFGVLFICALVAGPGVGDTAEGSRRLIPPAGCLVRSRRLNMLEFRSWPCQAHCPVDARSD